MKKHRFVISVLLSLALLLTGLPLHAHGNSTSLANADASSVGEQHETAAESNCPFHKLPESSVTEDVQPFSSKDVDCCGPDCRCQCAGLTLMVAQSTTSSIGQTRPSKLPGSAILPAKFHLDTPLRPPQA